MSMSMQVVDNCIDELVDNCMFESDVPIECVNRLQSADEVVDTYAWYIRMCGVY